VDYIAELQLSRNLLAKWENVWEQAHATQKCFYSMNWLS